MPPENRPDAFRLMRVRIRRSWFDTLQAAADRETLQSGTHTTLSDIVRSALMDWMNTHNCAPGRRSFVPSGLAEPPNVILAVADADLNLEADLVETLEGLSALRDELTELDTLEVEDEPEPEEAAG